MSRRLHIVAYDIGNQRRWRRLFKLMKQRGAHRQLSVFLVMADGAGIRKLANEIAGIIDPAADTVLIAPIDRAASSRMVELGMPGPVPGAQLLVI